MSDDAINFASSTVSVGPSPATSCTTLTLESGPPSPTPPYDLTCWPPGQNPTYLNAEIVRVLAQTGNVVTSMTRNPYQSSPQPIVAGWNAAQNLTAAMLGQLATPAATFSGFLAPEYPYSSESLGENLSFPFDPVGFTFGSVAVSATTVPMVVAPGGGLIVGAGAGLIVSVQNIDTTNDEFSLSAFVIVSNLTGTEVLSIRASASIPMSGPGASGAIDWTTATPTAVAGTDLTFTGVGVTIVSTAGGIFVMQFIANGDWV